MQGKAKCITGLQTQRLVPLHQRFTIYGMDYTGNCSASGYTRFLALLVLLTEAGITTSPRAAEAARILVYG